MVFTHEELSFHPSVWNLAHCPAPFWAFWQTEVVYCYTPSAHLIIWWLKLDYILEQLEAGRSYGGRWCNATVMDLLEVQAYVVDAIVHHSEI